MVAPVIKTLWLTGRRYQSYKQCLVVSIRYASNKTRSKMLYGDSFYILYLYRPTVFYFIAANHYLNAFVC